MIYNCAIIWPNQHPHHGSSRLHPLLRPHPQPLQDQDTLPQEVTVYQVEVTMIMMMHCDDYDYEDVIGQIQSW